MKCRLNSSVCNNKQRWNEDKCRCECRELVGKKRCDKDFIWNPSTCNCECDKSCDGGEYLDHENYKCKKMIDQLVEKCSENIDENEMIYNRTNRKSSISFFHSITNIKNFDLNLLSMNKISFEKNTDCVIYETKYLKNLDSENSLYQIFNNVNAIPLKMIVKLNIWFFLLQTKIEKH